MKTETRVKIDAKIAEGVPLTLDERVYYHEVRTMPPFALNAEPFLQTAQDVKDFFQKRGRTFTDESIAEWLDGQNVPK